MQEMEPLQGQSGDFTPVCAKNERNDPASDDPGYSQLRQQLYAWHVVTMLTHFPLSHLFFLLVQTYLQNGLRQLII